MFGNIWISSALVITAMISAGAMYKSYSDIQEIKQVQEHYEIISEIKTLIAKQYKKNPNEITRDEIIALLPKGENWEKILLIDRNASSTWANKALLNENGNLEINENEKLKLLALKSKLKSYIDINAPLTPTDNKYTFDIGEKEKNSIIQDEAIENSLTKAIDVLAREILYSTPASISAVLDDVVTEFTPYDKFYFDFLENGETSISDSVKKTRQENYFREKIKERLYKNENSIETRLYKELKDIL